MLTLYVRLRWIDKIIYCSEVTLHGANDTICTWSSMNCLSVAGAPERATEREKEVEALQKRAFRDKTGACHRKNLPLTG